MDKKTLARSFSLKVLVTTSKRILNNSWRERLKIWKLTKFKRDTLKASENIVPQITKYDTPVNFGDFPVLYLNIT